MPWQYPPGRRTNEGFTGVPRCTLARALAPGSPVHDHQHPSCRDGHLGLAGTGPHTAASIWPWVPVAVSATTRTCGYPRRVPARRSAVELPPVGLPCRRVQHEPFTAAMRIPGRTARPSPAGAGGPASARPPITSQRRSSGTKSTPPCAPKEDVGGARRRHPVPRQPPRPARAPGRTSARIRHSRPHAPATGRSWPSTRNAPQTAKMLVSGAFSLV